MKIEVHQTKTLRIAELLSEEIIIHTIQDGLDILGDVYYQGFDKLILHQKNITPAFFDLKTGIAGEILQKFSTYRMPLSIVGDFANVESKSLHDFIRESNAGKQVNFVGSVEEGL